MIPKKVQERMVPAFKRLLPIIQTQKSRDVSEADTVTLVKDALSEVFGYDKYQDLTGEFAIRGTYCDLAIKLEGKLSLLIEVKAVGITLNEKHLKQVIDYAANYGAEWVILTNACVWRLYHVIFAKPIDKQLVAELDINTVDLRKDDSLDLLYLFSKEGFKKGVHLALRDKQDALNRFVISALLLHNDEIKNVIRRELRRVVEINVAEDEITQVLRDQVIKRDNLEGPASEEARLKVKSGSKKMLRSEAPIKASGAKSNSPAAVAESADGELEHASAVIQDSGDALRDNDSENMPEGELAGASGNE